MSNDITLKLKMLDQVNHEADREMQISTSVTNIIEEMIKNGKKGQSFIQSLEKVEDSDLSNKTKAFLIKIREEELKALADPMEIMKDISEHLNLKHILCENMKNM
ncbi:hypothetical protein Tco_0815817 [Tanacetum coccineum]